MIRLLKKLKLISILPITHEALLILGYKRHVCGYYCAPYPADGSTYRLDWSAVIFDGNKPRLGTEEWRAYITNNECSTIRRFKTLSELNYFHKGMCGAWLF